MKQQRRSHMNNPFVTPVSHGSAQLVPNSNSSFLSSATSSSLSLLYGEDRCQTSRRRSTRLQAHNVEADAMGLVLLPQDGPFVNGLDFLPPKQEWLSRQPAPYSTRLRKRSRTAASTLENLRTPSKCISSLFPMLTAQDNPHLCLFSKLISFCRFSLRQKPSDCIKTRNSTKLDFPLTISGRRASLPGPCFLETLQKNGGVTVALRQDMIYAMKKLCLSLGYLHPETLFYAVTYMDRYLSAVLVRVVSQRHLLAVACVFVSAKLHEEHEEPNVERTLRAATFLGSSFGKKQLLRMERRLLMTLDFNLCLPSTPFTAFHEFLLILENCSQALRMEQREESPYLAGPCLADSCFFQTSFVQQFHIIFYAQCASLLTDYQLISYDYHLLILALFMKVLMEQFGVSSSAFDLLSLSLHEELSLKRLDSCTIDSKLVALEATFTSAVVLANCSRLSRSTCNDSAPICQDFAAENNDRPILFLIAKTLCVAFNEDLDTCLPQLRQIIDIINLLGGGFL